MAQLKAPHSLAVAALLTSAEEAQERALEAADQSEWLEAMAQAARAFHQIHAAFFQSDLDLVIAARDKSLKGKENGKNF